MDSIWCYLRHLRWHQESCQSRNEAPRYLESVHCGLTASRVRSRAHLLKSGSKMTGLKVSECLPREMQMCLTCWYRAVPVVMVDFVRMLPALGSKVQRT